MKVEGQMAAQKCALPDINDHKHKLMQFHILC